MPEPNVISYNSKELLAQYDPRQRMREYLSLLREENRRTNLVSRETNIAGLTSLYAESLIPLQLLSGSEFDSYLDIGSGGGYPAIPLALSGQVQKLTLVERIHKKAAALQRMSLALSLPVQIVPLSIEQMKSDKTYDLITLRLVKLDRPILRAVEKLLAPGSLFAYFSSTELTPASSDISKAVYHYRIDSQTITKSLTLFKKQS
ncbi:MAG: class I SAM-dependent methyltransferase [bacterium]|nr:class I SAM-dependent methyltransferase [bacterium]